MTQAGRVFNIQRFAVHDGPGVRTTVFLKGCPARCVWCHNPESQSPDPEILRLADRCIDCGSCRDACPNGTDETRCTRCGRCAEACPTGARQLAGRMMTVAEVMQDVLADRVFFEESGGGLTVSGGEPLSQPAFLRALLGAAKSEGLSTVVDTCGAGALEALLAVAPLVDVFLYDVKLADPVRHLALTGLPLAPILDNLEALGAVHRNIWLRVPIVPGFTDEEASLDATARLAARTPGVRRVHLLPYHRTGASKFARLHRPYLLEDVQPPRPDHLAALARIFEAHHVETRIGG
ncbi:MAG: glycyl-radical enzyme activating protein [Betaproteobacteria bacterium]